MATGKGFVWSAVLAVVLAVSSRGHGQGFHLPLDGPLEAPLPEDFLTIDPYADGDIKHDHDIIILEDANDPKSSAHGPLLPPSFGLPPSLPPALPPSFGKPSFRPSLSKRPHLAPPVGKHPGLPPPVGLPHSFGKPHSLGKPSTLPPSFGKPHSLGKLPSHPPSFGKPHSFGKLPTLPPSFGKPSTLPPSFGKRPTRPPFTGKPSVRPPFGLPPSFGRPTHHPSFSKLPTHSLSHPATLPPVVNTPVPAHLNSVADTAASSFYPRYPPFTQHDLGYDPFVYTHPTPDEGAYFPTHGFNVLKNLDSPHLEDEAINFFFPSNGYNLDPYFKDFPVFGYFQYAPEFDGSHEIDIAHEFDTTHKFDTAHELDTAHNIDIPHDFDTALNFDTAPRRRRMTPHREGRVLKASPPLAQGVHDLPLSSETGPHMPSLPKQGVHE